MFGKKMRRLTGLLALLALLACVIIPSTAFGDPVVTAKSATPMGDTYYKTTLGISKDPSLTLKKYQSTDGTTVVDSKPINGVEFKYVKVGGLYQVELSDGSNVLAYGITSTFANAVGLANADYTCVVDQVEYQFFKDGTAIQNATKIKNASDLEKFLEDYSATTVTTEGQGSAECELDTNPWGLYLVVETDVSGAVDTSGKPLAITMVQSPFLVAIPTSTADGWDPSIVANIKNTTDDAKVEKKIIVNEGNNISTDNKTLHSIGNDDLDDTDTTSIGDTVWYRLKSTVPSIPSGGSEIKSYVLTDNISKGLSVNKSPFTVTYFNGTDEEAFNDGDYVVSELTGYDSSADSDKGHKAAFDGGKTFTIIFTSTGLEKINNLAQSGNSTREIYVRYSAQVTADAVVGPARTDASPNSGNPNEVKLTYQVEGVPEITTDFDVVTHFTFGIDVLKTLEGSTDSNLFNSVKFKVYTKDSGGAKTYYSFTGGNGAYNAPVAATTGVAAATELTPNTSGILKIDGLKLGTYYLEETATASGYRLLSEPVEFKVESTAKGTNNFVSNSNQYLGTLTGSTSGRLSATVVNTKGFSMPSTGESGIWICVVGGIAIVAAGCLYLSRALRRASE